MAASGADITTASDRPSPAQGLYLIGFTIMITALTAVSLPATPCWAACWWRRPCARCRPAAANPQPTPSATA